MAERHKYDYEALPHSAGQKVARLVGHDKRVLEIGSGPGAVTRLLAAQQCHVDAIENDASAIPMVEPFCEQVIQIDLNNNDWTTNLADEEPYDTIVAADVLEHLQDPWTTLESMRPLLSASGSVVVSLPNIGHSAVVASLLAGRFDYQPWGLLDRTHVRFFAAENVERLFSDAGFKIVEIDLVVKEPEDTEFAKSWRSLPVEHRKMLQQNPFGKVYQYVVKAVPSDAQGDAVSLDAAEVRRVMAGQPAVAHGKLKRLLTSYISLKNRQRIGRVINSLDWRR